MAIRMHPRYEAAFREETNTPTKMDTVSFARFICRRCGRDRPIQGRKSLGRKQGYKCAECAGEKAPA